MNPRRRGSTENGFSPASISCPWRLAILARAITLPTQAITDTKFIQTCACLRARAIIFSGSTSNAEVNRNKVFKVGFRKPCSIKATVCRDTPAFWASKFKETRRFSRSAFNKWTTCKLMASGIRLTGTLKGCETKFFDFEITAGFFGVG